MHSQININRPGAASLECTEPLTHHVCRKLISGFSTNKRSQQRPHGKMSRLYLNRFPMYRGHGSQERGDKTC